MGETTSKLFQKLCSPGGRALLDQPLTAPSCAQALRNLLDRADISASDWITAADISRSYGYQILRGERIPGRDILLRTALALHLSVEEAQRLLTLGGVRRPLSPAPPGRGGDLCLESKSVPSGN